MSDPESSLKAQIQAMPLPQPGTLHVLTLAEDAGVDWWPDMGPPSPTQRALNMWVRAFPGCRVVVLPHGMTLAALSDDDLARLSLARVDRAAVVEANKEQQCPGIHK